LTTNVTQGLLYSGIFIRIEVRGGATGVKSLGRIGLRSKVSSSVSTRFIARTALETLRGIARTTLETLRGIARTALETLRGIARATLETLRGIARATLETLRGIT
tara:strand:+ start:698 stop:1012 length:315 start_codon:yes stop_codon:yes gene_type:complete